MMKFLLQPKERGIENFEQNCQNVRAFFNKMILTKTDVSGEWLMYVSIFFGATIIATVIVCLVYPNLKKVSIINKMKNTFC